MSNKKKVQASGSGGIVNWTRLVKLEHQKIYQSKKKKKIGQVIEAWESNR